MSGQLDAQGEAHEALSSAVASYGPRVLSDPRILGNLVADLLPDLPRERSLLVTAAEADVAGELAQHVEQQHLDAVTAVQLVARALTDRRSLDPAASVWVATEYAQALGYPVGPAAPPTAPPPFGTASPPNIPAAQPTVTAVTGWESPQAQTLPPPQGWNPAAGGYGGYPGQPPAAGGPPAAPPGGQPPAGGQPPGPVWPPMGPALTGPPAGPSRPRRGRVMAAGATAAFVVLYLVIAAVAHLTPFPGPSPTPTPTPTFTPTTPTTPSPTTPAPSTAPASSIAPLTQLLPADLDAPATQCHAATAPYKWNMPGLVKALVCNDPGLPNGHVYAYQMQTAADYQTTWASYNKWWGFTSSTPGSNCPPAGTSTSAEGTTGWHGKFFPSRAGQVLECEWVGSGNSLNEPAYSWTYPTENAFVVAQAAPNSTFSTLDSWWTNNAGPPSSPSPAAS
jgi:hypothetical protein